MWGEGAGRATQGGAGDSFGCGEETEGIRTLHLLGLCWTEEMDSESLTREYNSRWLQSARGMRGYYQLPLAGAYGQEWTGTHGPQQQKLDRTQTVT